MGLFFRFTGITFFIRNVIARKKVTILLYHNPQASLLENHLEYLSKRFSFITLDVLVDAINLRDWSSIPSKALVITFDDGHKGNYELLDTFKKYKVIPTIYLCTEIVNTNRHFWWTSDIYNRQQLKRLSNVARIKHLENKYGFTPLKEYGIHDRQALNLEEMALMKDAIHFESHTRFHPILTTCEEEECRLEICESKKEVEALIGTECRHFSFPNGDYTEREIEYVRDAGYKSSRTIDLGWNDQDSDPFRLKTMGVSDNAPVNYLAIQVCGIPLYLTQLLKGRFHGKWKTITLE